ncbi:MAG: hypothetical protein ACK4MF_09705 [Hyphomicrobiaceae bacterium]
MAVETGRQDGGNAPAGEPEISALVVMLVTLLVGVWAYLVSVFGFPAFIYPLLGLVGLAFAFILTLTRA